MPKNEALSKMTKAALLEVAKQKEISVPKNAKKEDIIELISKTTSGDAAASVAKMGGFKGEY